MTATPEQIARQKIDAVLTAAGWVIQDMKDFNRNATLGVAVREFLVLGGELLVHLAYPPLRHSGMNPRTPPGSMLPPEAMSLTIAPPSPLSINGCPPGRNPIPEINTPPPQMGDSGHSQM